MQPADCAALVLAAGRGTRLRPLTDLRPKPLCPVANVPLLERALEEVAALLGPVGPDRLVVNAHYRADDISAFLGARATISVEEPTALGTAGAVGAVRRWLDGRPLLIRNADVWRGGTPPRGFLDDWTGRSPRLLVVDDPDRPDFGGRWRFAGMSLLPAETAHLLSPEPAGLYEAVWAKSYAAGALELVESTAPFIDCGTPADYLAANLLATGEGSCIAPDADVRGSVHHSVVGARAVVVGSVESSVVWDGAVVAEDERLDRAIRADGGVTVAIPSTAP
jgi:N-acetyl-alpha-D-muramate 1-phosphate uridylyltransferase